MSISSSSLSTSSTSTPLLQCPQHTPHADTHDMPALMQLHFMVWHCLSPSLQLQQIPFRRLSGAIQPVSILGLSFLLPSNSHPLQLAQEQRYLDASILQLGDVHEGNAVLLHFPLVVSGRGRFCPLMLASGISDSEPFQGEYPHSHI